MDVEKVDYDYPGREFESETDQSVGQDSAKLSNIPEPSPNEEPGVSLQDFTNEDDNKVSNSIDKKSFFASLLNFFLKRIFHDR